MPGSLTGNTIGFLKEIDSQWVYTLMNGVKGVIFSHILYAFAVFNATQADFAAVMGD